MNAFVVQAKSGMGKTAVFVLSTLHLLEPSDDNVQVPSFVLVHVQPVLPFLDQHCPLCDRCW